MNISQTSLKLPPSIIALTPHRYARLRQPIANYDDLVELADDLSAVLAQFRRRADAERRWQSTSDPFERILEEESEPKVDSLHVITQSSAISKQVLFNFVRSMFLEDSALVMVLRELIKRRKLARTGRDGIRGSSGGSLGQY